MRPQYSPAQSVGVDASGSSYLTADQAATIAGDAHGDQTDKSGAPYIYHPARVAARLASVYGPNHPVVAVGWLHDTLEDSTITSSDLAALGASPRQLAALAAITHTTGEPQPDYLARVATDPMASVAKIADIDDNASPRRLSLLPAEQRVRLRSKYLTARCILGDLLSHPDLRLDSPDLFIMVNLDLPAYELDSLIVPSADRPGGLGELSLLVQGLRSRVTPVDIPDVFRGPLANSAAPASSLLEIVTKHGSAAALRSWRSRTSPHQVRGRTTTAS